MQLCSAQELAIAAQTYSQEYSAQKKAGKADLQEEQPAAHCGDWPAQSQQCAPALSACCACTWFSTFCMPCKDEGWRFMPA
jgi:hypothetical protein